jgi:4-amino-4-deoxy-L-arabinose transferase-like glycosyltransferase
MPRSRIPDWLLLLAFCAFFFLWGLASIGLIGADEPRYAQVAREMLARHDWITPVLSGNPWLEKPPLYYWQAIIAYKIFGVSDWAARLPSAVDGFALVFAVYWFLRRSRPGFELDGALMLASASGIAGYARAASMDLPLAGAFTIAMLAWFAWFESGSRAYLAAFYAFLAVAMLAKGPVAPALAAVILAVFIFAAVERSAQIGWNQLAWKMIVRKALWLPGILLFCAISLPWYILVQLKNPQFFHKFIVEHNLARFGTNLYHHPEPFWYYLPVTLLGWMPWAIFAVAACGWAARRLKNRDADSLDGFLLIWIAVVVLFFSISRSKLPGYVLPAIPPGIVLLSRYVRARIGSKPRLAMNALHAALAGALVFSALIIPYLALQRRIPWNIATLVPITLSVAIAAAMFASLRKYGYPSLRFITLVPAVLALGIAVRSGAPALDATLSARPVAAALQTFDPHPLPVAVFLVSRETEFGLQFYRNQAVPRYELGQIPDGEHLVIAPQGREPGVARNAGNRKVTYLGDFPSQHLVFFYVAAKQ